MKIYLNEETIRDSNGNTYEGDRDKIVKTLVRFGATQQEREHVLSGGIAYFFCCINCTET
jgi:hypothetical protein